MRNSENPITYEAVGRLLLYLLWALICLSALVKWLEWGGIIQYPSEGYAEGYSACVDSVDEGRTLFRFGSQVKDLEFEFQQRWPVTGTTTILE